MIKYDDYFFKSLIVLLPFTLITGPAVPDISITITGIYFIFLFFYRKIIRQNFKNEIILYTIIYWILILIISFFSINKFLSLQEAIIFIRILIIPIFLSLWILENEKTLKKLITIIFYLILFVCFDSLYQFYNYNPEHGFQSDIFGFVPDFYGRLTGPFKNELVPGSYISKFSLIGLIYLLAFVQHRFKSYFIVFYLSLIGIVCYASGERMALATYLLGLFFLTVFFKKYRFEFSFSLILIFFLCFIINKTHPIYNDYKIIESKSHHLGLKVEKEFDCFENIKCKKVIEQQPSFFEIIKNFRNSAYGQIYGLAIKMWKDYPITGIGLNNFTYLCNNDLRYINKIKNYNCTNHPHNFYLQWLVETGLIGFILFILYLAIILKNIFIKQINYLSLISFGTLLILFWPIMSTGSLLKNWMGISTFFIIGICLSLNKIKQKI